MNRNIIVIAAVIAALVLGLLIGRGSAPQQEAEPFATAEREILCLQFVLPCTRTEICNRLRQFIKRQLINVANQRRTEPLFCINRHVDVNRAELFDAVVVYVDVNRRMIS